MKQTFLVFLLTLFLCGSASAYNVMFDGSGSGDPANLNEIFKFNIEEKNEYNALADEGGAIFSYLDSTTGNFTETFTSRVTKGLYDVDEYDYSDIYIDTTLYGNHDFANNEITFDNANSSITMYKDSDEDLNYTPSSTDVEIATLKLINSEATDLRGDIFAGTGEFDLALYFQFNSPLNPDYWGLEEQNLTDKGWLLSWTSTNIIQPSESDPFADNVWDINENDYDTLVEWTTDNGQISFEAVPEPSTMILLGLGLLGLAGIGRRKLKN